MLIYLCAGCRNPFLMYRFVSERNEISDGAFLF